MDDVDMVLALASEITSLRSQLAQKEALLGSLMGLPAKNSRASTAEATTTVTGRRPAKGTVTAAIVDALRRSDNGLRIPEIARAVGSNADSVGTMLRRLVARGYVVRATKGQYRAS
jgi:predicted transcriptional regulator